MKKYVREQKFYRIYYRRKKSEKINETKEKEMFDFITHPHVFTFTNENEQIWVERIENGQISVERTGKTKPNKFHLLKTSEEVMEAKIASLLWHISQSCGSYLKKTICLEDPDREMHPNMIEGLNGLVHQWL